MVRALAGDSTMTRYLGIGATLTPRPQRLSNRDTLPIVEDDLDAACITVVRGVPADELIRRLGGDPVRAERRDVAACSELARGPFDLVPVAQFWDEGDCGVVVEPNGFAAADEVVAARLSAGGRLVTLYWSVNFDMRLLVAVDGTVLRDLDPLFGEVTASPESGAPLPEEDGLRFGDEEADPIAEAMVLAGRVTGVRLDRATLATTPRPTVVLGEDG